MRKDTGFNRALCCIAFNESGYIKELIGAIGEALYLDCLDMGYIKVDGDRWVCSPWVHRYLKKRNVPYKRIFRNHWRELLLESKNDWVDSQSFWWKLRHWYMFSFEFGIYYVD